MIKKLVSLAISLILCLNLTVGYAFERSGNINTIPGTNEEMLNPNYWIEKIDDASKLIMTEKQINVFNQNTIDKVNVVYDLEKYKSELTKDELLGFIQEYKIPTKQMYFSNGDMVKQDFYNSLVKNTNLDGIKDTNPVKYGITVRDTSLRTFPTDIGVYSTKGDIEFDRFQETGCQAIEPVIILHTSLDQNWYFVQMYNYRGWVKSSDIALSNDKNTIFDYLNTNNFIVVTGNHIRTQYNPFEISVSELEFDMGTKISLEKNSVVSVGNQNVFGNYLVKLPTRDQNGNLVFKDALISKTQDLNFGYLPYTRANIIKQAFKLLGDRYGWGDSFNGRDCSSFIMYIYKTFGFRLPRNTGEQEDGAGISYKFTEGTNAKDRIKLFENIKPGAAIYMPGHAMMYIGMYNVIPYMIHDFSGYGEKNGNKYEFVPVNEVAVTSTLLPLSSGVPFIERFTSLLQFENSVKR